MNKRRFFALPVLALAALSFLGASGMAAAQQFPSRPVTYIIPWAPGGSSDATARALARTTSKYLGQVTRTAFDQCRTPFGNAP